MLVNEDGSINLDAADDMSEADVVMSLLQERYFHGNDANKPCITIPTLTYGNFKVGDRIEKKGISFKYTIIAFCTMGYTHNNDFGYSEGDIVAFLCSNGIIAVHQLEKG